MRTATLTRAAAVTVALILLVVGLPILLVIGVGWPLPHTLPSPDGISHTLTSDQPLDPNLVINFLAVILWVGWAAITASLLRELEAVRHGRTVRPLAGLGPAQAVASYLIGALLLATSSTAVALPARPASAAVELLDYSTTAVPSTAPTTALDERETTPTRALTHTVRRHDNLWTLAERYLAPAGTEAEIAAAVQAIFDRNAGVRQPDGRALVDAGDILPGWVLTIDIPTTQPISNGSAREVTVQPGDWLSTIAERELGDIDAWHDLYDTNVGRPQPDGRTLTDEDHIRPGWKLHLPAPTASARPVAPPPVTVSEPEADPSTWTPAPTRVAGPATAEPAPPTAPAALEIEVDDEHSTSPVGLAALGLTAAGIVTVLERRRRARRRRREPFRHLATPNDSLQQTERLLHVGADHAGTAAIDLAVRAATEAPDLPPLLWVQHHHGTVELVLSRPAAPPPGFTAAASDRWQPSDPQRIAELAANAVPPAPLLMPFGRTTDGAEVLVDLETHPTLAVTGPDDEAAAFLRAVALAATTLPWAEQVDVVTVGLPDAFHALPSVTSLSGWAEAFDAVEERVERANVALARLGSTSTWQARAAGLTPDDWRPLLVIGAAPPDGPAIGRLTGHARQHHRGVAVVCATGTQPIDLPGIELRDGTFVLPGSDLLLTSRALDADDTEAVLDLLDQAVAAEVVDTPHLVEPLPNRGSADESEQRLDGLLAEMDVLVRVLGEVEAVRLDPAGETQIRPERHKALEAVVYLACREGSVNGEDIQAALWPDGANSIKTFQNVITTARRALGSDRDTQPLLPPPEDSRYELSPSVATDYDLFHELIERAATLTDHGSEVAAGLLADALTLVRGEPFTGAGRGYAWVAQHRGVLATEVITAAERLAETRLDAGDWRGAEWAARQGLRAFPADERLYRLLMRAAHRAGSIPGVHRAFRELCDAVADPDLGVEPEDTIHPETLTLLESLTGTSRAPRAIGA